MLPCRRCMPWDEVDKGIHDDLTGMVRALIRLRREEATFRSLYFHFPCEISTMRCIEYIKLDKEGRRIKVLLNASDDPVKVPEADDILFSRRFKEGELEANGTLIYRLR